jgi:hypothetical protein
MDAGDQQLGGVGHLPASLHVESLHHLTDAAPGCDDRRVSGPCHADTATRSDQRPDPAHRIGATRQGGLDPRQALALQRRAGNRATRAAFASWGARRTLARDPDPLAASFDFKATSDAVAAAATALAADKTTERRHVLIRLLKRIVRLATPEQQQQVRGALDTTLGATDAAAVWAAAGTAFGGYTGMFPGFAPDVKRELGNLGASDTVSFGTFELSGSGATHKSRAKAVAAGEISDLSRTDIVYFRGHQFAQYRAPGLFSNGDETRGSDLRYVDQPGGFPNVRLMISTSCATLCLEAFEVFHRLFPNAVILGYRKSAPLHGEAVRKALTAKVKAIGRPLLLEEPTDIAAVVGAWKQVIEQQHKGESAPVPGFYDGTDIQYWDGTAWGTIPPTDPHNVCKRKGDFRGQYPAPPP